MHGHGRRKLKGAGSARGAKTRFSVPRSIAGKRYGKLAGRRTPPPRGSSPGSRPVDGFLQPFPDPPRCVRRTSRCSVADGDLEPQTPVQAPPSAVRAGAPTQRPRVVTIGGETGYFLKKRQYKRLGDARNRLHSEVRDLNKRKLASLNAARRKITNKLAVASLLMIEGVSASKVPRVMAVVMKYALGFIPPKLLFVTSSALEYVRISGEVFKADLVKDVSASHPLSFFVGFYTSERGGHLGAFAVSFFNGLAPVHRFYGFDRPAGSSAADFEVSLSRVISELQKAGCCFGGFSTDAPNVMTGAVGGLHALIAERFPQTRHDTCEHHASARLLSVLDSLWPPVMNIPSVSQFLYISWYILNDDWDLHRGRILSFLNFPATRDDVKAVLSRFGSKEKAIDGVKKPSKPNKLRWGTLAEIVEFVPLYFEALQFAFNQDRETVGANAQSCSVAAICSQWIKWSGSAKLKSLLTLAHEFVCNYWEPQNNEIDLRDQDYDVDSCFKTFSRPRRVLDILMKIEDVLLDVTKLESFARIVTAFGADRREEVVQLCRHLFELAQDSGRYLSGIYLFGGLADPYFVTFVFEAFAWWKRKPDAPKVRTEKGRRLEKCLSDAQDADSAWLGELLKPKSWQRIVELVQVRGSQNRGKQRFLEMIVSAKPDDYVLFTLRTWLSALSHTRPVEKAFLDWDHQTSLGEGSSKGKSSKASGHQVAPTTRAAKVVIANQMHQRRRNFIRKVKPKKKKARTDACDDIAQSVDSEFQCFQWSDSEVSEARTRAKERQEFFRTPRTGISAEIRQIFESLESVVDGWREAKFGLRELLNQGADLDISLVPKCSPTCKKLAQVSKKGSPGKILTCRNCLRVFHYKCMVSDGLVDAGLKKDDLSKISFCCSVCSATKDESLSRPVVQTGEGGQKVNSRKLVSKDSAVKKVQKRQRK